MAACCYFEADLGNGLDNNFPSRLTDGTPHSSSDLLYSYLLPFTWTNYCKSYSISPFCSLGQNFSKSNCSFLGTKNFKAKFLLLFALSGQKNSKSKSKTTKMFQIPFWFWLRKIPSLLLNYSILLAPEFKQCPLTLASALACAESVDELQFWNKSESWIAQPLSYSILLPLESNKCPWTLALVLACADSADEFRFWSRSKF